jgi:hypothetical protein
MNLTFTVNNGQPSGNNNPPLYGAYAAPTITSDSGSLLSPLQPMTFTIKGTNFAKTSIGSVCYVAYWPTYLGYDNTTGGILYQTPICTCNNAAQCVCTSVVGIGQKLTAIIYVGNQPSLPFNMSVKYQPPASFQYTQPNGYLQFSGNYAGYLYMPSYLLKLQYGANTSLISAINCAVTSVSGVVVTSQCLPAASGCGTTSIILTIGDFTISSSPSPYTYSQSTVTTLISSSLIHTNGLSSVIWGGTNLGVIGGSACLVTATYVGTSGITQSSTCQPYSYNGTLISCTTNPGTDINQQWTFTVGGVVLGTGAELKTSYYAPIITMITPSGGFNTAGGEPFTVVGSEFGNNSTATYSVTIHLPPEFGGVATRTCSLITNYTTLACINTPPGVGGPWPIIASVPYQSSSLAYIYRYGAPVVTSITQPTVNISTDGSTSFNITGTNFGRYPNALAIYLSHDISTRGSGVYATQCIIPIADTRM